MEGEEYEFRIIAVNKCGPSEPSDPSAAIVAKARNCEKIFEHSDLFDNEVENISFISNAFQNFIKKLGKTSLRITAEFVEIFFSSTKN